MLFQKLEALLLGWYDLDKVNVPAGGNHSPATWRMVQIHEQIHQLINHSSSFGFLLERLGQAAREGRTEAQSLLINYMKICRSSHETAATYLGVTLCLDITQRTQLSREYAKYYETAEKIERIAPKSVFWRAVIVAQVVHCTFMTEWKDSIERNQSNDDDFMSMAKDYILDPQNSPNKRLATLLKHTDKLNPRVLIEAVVAAGIPRFVCNVFENSESPLAVIESLSLTTEHWPQLIVDFEQAVQNVIQTWAEHYLPGISNTRGELFNVMLIRQTAARIAAQFSSINLFAPESQDTSRDTTGSSQLDHLNQKKLERYLPTERKDSVFNAMFVDTLNSRPDLLKNSAVEFRSVLTMSLAVFWEMRSGGQHGNPEFLLELRRQANQRLLTEKKISLEVQETCSSSDVMVPLRHSVLIVNDSNSDCSIRSFWEFHRTSTSRLQVIPASLSAPIDKDCICVCENEHRGKEWRNVRGFDSTNFGRLLLYIEANLVDFAQAVVESGAITRWFWQKRAIDSTCLILFWVETWQYPFLAFCNQAAHDALHRYATEYLIDPTLLSELTDAQVLELMGPLELAKIWEHPGLDAYCRGIAIHNLISEGSDLFQ